MVLMLIVQFDDVYVDCDAADVWTIAMVVTGYVITVPLGSETT